jgi:hypothetical protein
MQIEGALVREQGIEFGIVIVQKGAMMTDSIAAETRAVFQAQIRDFDGIPLILASQDSRGAFEYHGRHDIVGFLASVDASRIPWRRYTVS